MMMSQMSYVYLWQLVDLKKLIITLMISFSGIVFELAVFQFSTYEMNNKGKPTVIIFPQDTFLRTLIDTRL